MTSRRLTLVAVVCSMPLWGACGRPGWIAVDGGGVRSFDVRDFGARGDGESLDTRVIQSAIDAASRVGGGTIRFTPGRYRSGTLILRSSVHLVIDQAATLVGSSRLEDYPLLTPTSLPGPDRHRRRALLFGENLHDVTLSGPGTIDGSGGADAFKITPPDWGTPVRPEIIVLISCQGVRVENLNLRDSPAWVQHYLHCDDVLLTGLNVYSHVNYNNDMMDIDGCRNVRVSNCTGNTGDDGVTLKSTMGRICENVTVTDCVLSSHANAVKLGTESTGGFRNITVGNIAIRPARAQAFHLGDRQGFAGVALEMVDGGVLEKVTVSNITIEGTTVPIFMRLGNCARKYRSDMSTPGVGTFRDVVVSNVVATGVHPTGCALAGLPGHPIENVTLSDIRITFAGGGTLDQFDRQIPERPDCYPECTMFGPLPAYGFYLRHVEGVTLRNIDLDFAEADRRPAVVCDDARRIRIDGLRARVTESTPALLAFHDTIGAGLTGCGTTALACQALVRLSGRSYRVHAASHGPAAFKQLVERVAPAPTPSRDEPASSRRSR